MTNESPQGREREIPTSTFEEWVAQKAVERDSSRERILEQLLDSYWTLEQVTQVLGGRGESLAADERSANVHGRPNGEETTRIVTEDEHDEVLETVETTRETVEELATTVDEVQSSLEVEQSRLDARMDEEFDNLRTILEYLVEKDENLGTRIAEAEVQYRAEIRQLRTEREQLRRLREDARDHGTHYADCEQCGETVDFTLLTSPDCPNCDRQLTGVTKETNWFVLSSYTATTGVRATDSGAPNRESNPSRGEQQTEQTERSDAEATTPSADDSGTEQTGADDHRSDGTERQSDVPEDRSDADEQRTDNDATNAESDESADQRDRTSTGTSPDETDFQWLT